MKKFKYECVPDEETGKVICRGGDSEENICKIEYVATDKGVIMTTGVKGTPECIDRLDKEAKKRLEHRETL